jgi:hypothetical protein
MKKARLEKLLGMVLATSTFGARGLQCGPCPEPFTTVIPLLPPSSDGGPSTSVDPVAEACKAMCAGGLSCVETTIELPNGTMPAIACTEPGGCGGAGRRPEGLCAPVFTTDAATPGGWLSRAAFLEAASVDAFRLLRRQLAELGAPRRLLRAASRAARDERRHARRMGALARRHGVAAPEPRVAPAPPVALEALATHNAAEGCVRETFGVVVARWQAAHAADRELGAAMARVAGDEARHAALAWQIDAWAKVRLDVAARARVERARAEAARALCGEAARPVPAALVTRLGVPDAAAAGRLAERLGAAIME